MRNSYHSLPSRSTRIFTLAGDHLHEIRRGNFSFAVVIWLNLVLINDLVQIETLNLLFWNLSPASTKLDRILESKNRSLLDSLSNELQITNFGNWYEIRTSQLVKPTNHLPTASKNEGNDLYIPSLRCCSFPSPFISPDRDVFYKLRTTLETLYPEFDWHPWQFIDPSFALPNGYWDNLSTQRKYFDYLSNSLGIQSLQDWYSITLSQIDRRGRNLLKKRYNDSLARALKEIYPHYDWKPWLFQHRNVTDHLDEEVWSKIDHRRKYFEWLLKEELQWKDLNDW